MALYRCMGGGASSITNGTSTRKTQKTKTYTYKYTSTTEWTIVSISNGGYGTSASTRNTTCTCAAGTVTQCSKGGEWSQSTIGSQVVNLGTYAGLYIVQAPIGSEITCKSTVDSSYASPSVIICTPITLS